MAERYQIGDQCYTGWQAAANAWIGTVEPKLIKYTFWPELGPQDAWVMPQEVDPTPEATGVIFKIVQMTDPGTSAQSYVVPHLATCSLDDEAAARSADAYELFGLLLVALVVVWGIKQLLNFFTQDMEKA